MNKINSNHIIYEIETSLQNVPLELISSILQEWFWGQMIEVMAQLRTQTFLFLVKLRMQTLKK